MSNTSGNTQSSKLDQFDRALDFTRYVQSRAKWLAIEKAQAELKGKSDVFFQAKSARTVLEEGGTSEKVVSTTRVGKDKHITNQRTVSKNLYINIRPRLGYSE